MPEKSFVSKMIEDGTGATSSMRVIFSLCPVVVLIVWVAVMVFNMFKASGPIQLTDIPVGVAGMIASIAFAKAGQSLAEK